MQLQKIQYLCPVRHHLGHGNAVCTQLLFGNTWSELFLLSAHRCIHIIDQSLQSINQVSALPWIWSAQSVCTFQVVTFSVNGPEKVSHLTAEHCLSHPRSLVFTIIHQKQINWSECTIAPINNKLHHTRWLRFEQLSLVQNPWGSAMGWSSTRSPVTAGGSINRTLNFSMYSFLLQEKANLLYSINKPFGYNRHWVELQNVEAAKTRYPRPCW
jgi:hypothetical protein